MTAAVESPVCTEEHVARWEKEYMAGAGFLMGHVKDTPLEATEFVLRKKSPSFRVELLAIGLFGRVLLRINGCTYLGRHSAKGPWACIVADLDEVISAIVLGEAFR